jgi:uncharacterized protein (DUF1697 family)
MRYVALLRGINVGGNSIVDMKGLRQVFEDAGMSDVKTYINSGNVMFTTDSDDRAGLVTQLEAAVDARYPVDAKIVLRSADEMATLVGEIPKAWTNGPTMKCDVVFLSPEVDSPSVLERLDPRPEIEDVIYLPGAVVWRVDRANATRSRLLRIVGTPFYKQVTIRNVNTARKLAELMRQE